MTALVLLDKNAKVGGLAQIRLHASDAPTRAMLSKIAALNTTWNRAKSLIESEMSKSVGRPVVLLNGNYVKQKKGVVSYHGTIKIPGSVYLPRKGFDDKASEFWLWVILK